MTDAAHDAPSPPIPEEHYEAHDALAIWRQGVAAVDSERLVRAAITVRGERLCIGDHEVMLSGVRRIEVVGAGKAGAGMAAGVEAALGPDLLTSKHVSGWLNVPADCVRPLAAIHLHAGRPAGVNEPTDAGAAGAEEILRRVSALGPDDVCLCLISGGGSALLPAPTSGISVADKQQVIRLLSGAGATIRELNVVRSALSRIKGGGLARACTAGRMFVLVISDVTGDPLDVIASAPTYTVADAAGDPLEPLHLLEQFGGRQAGIPQRVFNELARRPQTLAERRAPPCAVTHQIIGSNRTAVQAAAAEAQRLGYRVHSSTAETPEGTAEEVGRALMRRLFRDGVGSYECIVSGGEPVVSLPPADVRGRGGRNQQLALAALDELLTILDERDRAGLPTPHRFALLSGGTDGEDGPTNAAGAWIDYKLAQALRGDRAAIREALRRCDAYTYFQRLNSLVLTGPTHTNVMDVRVLCISATRPWG